MKTKTQNIVSEEIGENFFVLPLCEYKEIKVQLL